MRHIELIWTDFANITRCLFFTEQKFYGGIKDGGTSLPHCILSFPYFSDSPVEGPTGQVTFRPDSDTTPRPLPWLENADFVFGSFFEDNEKPWEYCPRAFVLRQAEALREIGIQMSVGFELEFFLLDGVTGVPLDSTVFGETKSMHGKSWKIISRIVEHMTALGIPVWRYHSESPGGQFEISIGPMSGCLLNAADSLVLARETIYHVAAELGVKATFVPKPFEPPVNGSGAHTHVSLKTSDGRNLFEVNEKIGNAFLSGVLEHLPSLMMIFAPTWNSYARHVPSTWTGMFQCLGTENKQTAVRLVRSTSGCLERFEVKPPDGICNPYLLVASIVGAGLDGIRKGLKLPAEINGDPFALPKDQQPPRLPGTLTEALDAFRDSSFTQELFGEKLQSLLVRIRQSELKHSEASEISPEKKLELLLQRF